MSKDTSVQPASDVDDQIDLTGDAYQRWASRAAPDLTRLPSAVRDEGGLRVLLADVGDVVIYNVFSTLLPGRPYLRTVKGRILQIDAPNGIAWVFDMDWQHQACFSWTCRPKDVNEEIRFPAGALKERHEELMTRAAAALEEDDLDVVIRLRNEAARVAALICMTEDETTGKRKIGRPRKVRTEAELAAEQERAERRALGEIKRGRPKGSKNRPKDVIEAERTAERQRQKKKKKKAS